MTNSDRILHAKREYCLVLDSKNMAAALDEEICSTESDEVQSHQKATVFSLGNLQRFGCERMAVPHDAFKQQLKYPENHFQVGMILKVNVDHLPYPCLLAHVVGIRGPRLKLRIAEFCSDKDFWRLMDSEDIHPVLCTYAYGRPQIQDAGLVIMTLVCNLIPMDVATNVLYFNYFSNISVKAAKHLESLLLNKEAILAPSKIFLPQPQSPKTDKFITGMKLEAVVKAKPQVIMAAIVGAVNYDKFEVIFDDGQGKYNYLCHYNSRDIFPDGWCKKNKHPLDDPKQKLCVFVNERCKSGPYLDPSKIAEFPVAFTGRNVLEVLKQCVQALVNAACDHKKILDELPKGSRKVMITELDGARGVSIHLPVFEYINDIWNFLKSLLIDLYCCENFYSAHRLKSCNLCEHENLIPRFPEDISVSYQEKPIASTPGSSLLQKPYQLKAVDSKSYRSDKCEEIAQCCFFKQRYKYPKNCFQPGMRLEVNVAGGVMYLGRLAIVISIQGPRLKLRFEGEITDENDFWMLMDSEDIHPVFNSTSHMPFMPPTGSSLSELVNMRYFVSLERDAKLAPNNIFLTQPKTPEKNYFKPGMKIEAVVKAKPDLILPATVGAVKDNELEVTFGDGRGKLNYSCRCDSRNIFPPGWCNVNKHPLGHPEEKLIVFVSKCCKYGPYFDSSKIERFPVAFTEKNIHEVLRKSVQALVNAAYDQKEIIDKLPRGSGKVVIRVESEDGVETISTRLPEIRKMSELWAFFKLFLMDLRCCINFYSADNLAECGLCKTSTEEMFKDLMQSNQEEPTASIPLSPLLSKSSRLKAISWESYTSIRNGKRPSFFYFKQYMKYPQNCFKPGMRLEVEVFEDKQCIFRLANVISVQGPRMKLRFEGEISDQDDFWKLMDSEDIHPVSYSKSLGVILRPPKGSAVCASEYLKTLTEVDMNAKIAPRDIFLTPPPKPKKNYFKPGMKIEAVVKAKPHQIWSATVGAINNNELQVTFDDGQGKYDYFCNCDSRNIFPDGWCKKNGHPLDHPEQKVCIFVNENCSHGPYLNSCKIKRFPVAFTGKNIDKVLKESVQAFVNAAYDQKDVFDILPSGSGKVAITAQGRIKDACVYLPEIQQVKHLWNFLNLLLMDLKCCINFLSADRLRSCAFCENGMEEMFENLIKKNQGTFISSWPKNLRPSGKPRYWTVEDVIYCITTIYPEFCKYANSFREMGIDGQALLTLTIQEMKTMCIPCEIATNIFNVINCLE